MTFKNIYDSLGLDRWTAADVVGVFDDDFNQLFPGARPLKASVKDDATFFKHPLEDSSNRTDHIIFSPIEVSMTLVVAGVDYESVYQQISQAFRSQTQLIVLTKVEAYDNMYIQSMPHEQTPGNFDAIVMVLGLVETKIAVTVAVFQPTEEADTNTVDRGQLEPVETENGSTLARWFL